MRRFRRVLAAGAVVLALSACYPSIQVDLPTPGTPLTYGWVMEHEGLNWWVQIGPKVDQDGTHVAIQGWISCQPITTYPPNCAAYNYFAEFETLVPGSVHRYRIAWNGTGWEMFFDGKLKATLNIGNPNTAKYEVNYGEKTTQ